MIRCTHTMENEALPDVVRALQVAHENVLQSLSLLNTQVRRLSLEQARCARNQYLLVVACALLVAAIMLVRVALFRSLADYRAAARVRPAPLRGREGRPRPHVD